jgi:hypothetical protein
VLNVFCRPPEGPIAPSFSQVQYEKLLNRESEYTNRIAELEAQVAKLTREKDELVKEVFSLRSGKASCMVCKVRSRSSPPFFLSLNRSFVRLELPRFCLRVVNIFVFANCVKFMWLYVLCVNGLKVCCFCCRFIG